ncbi:MAG: c-type cytochrome domain-containing protein, partial [Planctomycetota bacterium]
MNFRVALLVLYGLTCLPAMAIADDDGKEPADAAGKDAGAVSADQGQHSAFFRDDVLPILRDNCFGCHAGEHSKGGLQFDTRSRLMLGGDGGPVIDFESPEDSTLVMSVNYDGYEMPPKGQLAEEQIDVLTRWVSLGAPYP